MRKYELMIKLALMKESLFVQLLPKEVQYFKHKFPLYHFTHTLGHYFLVEKKEKLKAEKNGL